jgi:hypothetical protein
MDGRGGSPASGDSGPVRQLLQLERDGNFATVLCGLVDVQAHEVILARAPSAILQPTCGMPFR